MSEAAARNSNEVKAVQPTKELGKWCKLETSGLAPSAKNGMNSYLLGSSNCFLVGHTMVVHQKTFFISGGFNQNEYSNQFHMFSPGTPLLDISYQY